MNSELLRVIEAEAEAERQGVLAAARQQAADLVAQAEARAAGIAEESRLRAQAEEQAARTKAKSGANLEASALLLETKSRAIEALFVQAGQELEALPKERYRKVMERLVAEAAADLPGKLTVRVAPGDQDMAKDIVKKLSLEATVAADPAIKTGAVVADASGSTTVINLMRNRLEQARRLLTADIARTLWG